MSEKAVRYEMVIIEKNGLHFSSKYILSLQESRAGTVQLWICNCALALKVAWRRLQLKLQKLTCTKTEWQFQCKELQMLQGGREKKSVLKAVRTRKGKRLSAWESGGSTHDEEMHGKTPRRTQIPSKQSAWSYKKTRSKADRNATGEEKHLGLLWRKK